MFPRLLVTRLNYHRFDLAEVVCYKKTVQVAIIILFGLIFGSFSSVIYSRYDGEKLDVSGRSRCPKCSKLITWFYNIPVLGYLFLRGKSACCKQKISLVYPIIEITMAASFLLAYKLYGYNIAGFILAFCLVNIIFIDLKLYIIPDTLNILTAIVVLFLADFNYINYIIAAAICFGLRGLMMLWKKQEGLGLGDVKMLIALSPLLTLESTPIFLLCSGILGIIFGMLMRKKREDGYFPFAPSLIVSLAICLGFNF
jgi:leader peptidase (prepilin peptidase) / N-methyltransferase